MGTKDHSNHDQNERINRTRALSEEALVESLKKCRAMAMAHANTEFPAFLKQLDDRLYELSEGSATNQERTQIFENQKEFSQRGEELNHHFCGCVGEAYIKFKKGTLDTRTEAQGGDNTNLSLVENEKLEERIAVSSIAHRADSHFAEQIWMLNQRFAVLADTESIQESSNPLGPIQYCDALRRTLLQLSIDSKAKVIAYKLFDKVFIPRLSLILDDINDYLVELNVLPGLQFTPGVDNSPISAGSGVASDGAIFEQNPGLQASGAQLGSHASVPGTGPATADSGAYQGNLVNAIRELQSHLAGAAMPLAQGAGLTSGAPATFGNSATGVPSGLPGGAPVGGGAGRQMAVYSNQQLVGALQSMQAQALSLTSSDTFAEGSASMPPQSIAAMSTELTRKLQEENDDDGAVDTTDMHTIDLVGMLFEYMLADDNLPSSVKALLSYLHTPFLKIAFIDKDFFEQSEHPARLLLNDLAEAGSKWVATDGSSQYEIYPKIKAVVSQLLEEFENDVRIFAELLLEFSAYTKKISRRQDLMEQRALEKAQGEEKLREVKIQVNQEVRARTDDKQLPSAVLLLLLQPWSDYLSFVLLRYGEESGTWQDALAVIDDLLWTIEPKRDEADKARHLGLVETLEDALKAGFESIAYDQAKGKKLLAALKSLQKLGLESKLAEPAPSTMRNKLETQAAEKAGRVETPEREITDDERKMVESLQMIEFGTWFEFEAGKRLKVAWYNSKTTHYMLVDKMGKKVAMKSGLDLAREMISGDAKIIAGSSKPFFERALENILHNLNARAEGGEQNQAEQ